MRISDWSSDVCSSDLAKFLFQGADRCNPRRMIGMVAMAHIDAESIGSGKIKFADHLRAIAGRTQRCQYFDLARSWTHFLRHIHSCALRASPIRDNRYKD